MNIKEFILEYRQTGSTKNLIKLIKETNGYLIFGSRDQKDHFAKKHPEIKNNLFTLYEALDGKMTSLPKAPLFFDNSAMYSISDIEKEIKSEEIKKFATTQIQASRIQEQILSGELKIEDVPNLTKKYLNLETWKSVFDNAAEDQGFKINLHAPIEISKLNLNSNDTLLFNSSTNFVSNEKKECNKQLNVKLHEEDLEEINSINKDFFEGEASNSMIGRILLRKGIAFYKKLKAMI